MSRFTVKLSQHKAVKESQVSQEKEARSKTTWKSHSQFILKVLTSTWVKPSAWGNIAPLLNYCSYPFLWIKLEPWNTLIARSLARGNSLYLCIYQGQRRWSTSLVDVNGWHKLSAVHSLVLLSFHFSITCTPHSLHYTVLYYLGWSFL